MQKRLGVLLLVICAVANADIVAFSVAPSGTAFQYSFSVTNTAATSGTIYDLFLSLPTAISNIDTATLGTPPGWGDSTGGLLFFGPDVGPSTAFIEWSADVSGAFDISPGSSLSGFSFTSFEQITGPINFALNGSTIVTPAQQVSDVPEPRYVVLVGSALWLICRFRRTRPVMREPSAIAGCLSKRAIASQNTQ